MHIEVLKFHVSVTEKMTDTKNIENEENVRFTFQY